MHDDSEDSEVELELDDANANADVVVPLDRLSEAALLGVISEFVTREGTEYGESDVSLDRKVESVRRQLERGEVVVLYDARSETVNLVHARELRR